MTEGAAAQFVLPDCVACMVHVPVAARVTVAVDTVQTDGVCELKLTVSPDVAEALTGNGDVPNDWPSKVPNVIV